jgi:hypothetical protein
MAAVTFTTAGADLVTNATSLAASDSSLTAAQFTALGHLLSLIGARHAVDLAGPMKMLTDTDKAQLNLG